MEKIVVCDDVDRAFQNSGELARTGAVGTVAVHNRVAETREHLLQRLHGATRPLGLT